MNAKPLAASVSHVEATIAELRDDPAFAVEYLRAAAIRGDRTRLRCRGPAAAASPDAKPPHR